MQKNKKKDDKATEGFTESSLPKHSDGTLLMETFYSYLPNGKYKEEMEKYTDLDVLFGKLKYNSFFNKGPEAEFLRGSYAEKKHTFQANQLKIVWGNDPEEDEINAYRIIVLLILVRYSLLHHKSCEEVPAPAYVMTDIHGQFSDLLRWFFKTGGPEQHNFNLVCTGDMVDRGLHQLETVCLFLYYKLKFPTRVFVLRGNHEDFDLHETYGFLPECNERFSKNAVDPGHQKLAKNIWYMFIHVFDYLPTVCVVEKKFMCVHGGISPYLAYCQTCMRNGDPLKVLDTCTKHKNANPVDQLISTINFKVRTPVQVGKNYVQPSDIPKITKMKDLDKYTSLFADLIWSDPKSFGGAHMSPKDANWMSLKGWTENKARQISFEFGTDVIEKFITQFSLTTLVRGHEPKVQGYEWHYMKRCITVFSAPNYTKSNDAAIAMITEKKEGNTRKLRLDPIQLVKTG
ncbi:hypothetical protein BOX15_Mlig016310g1 [Macrostomum lignano]|uniref:Uncharacterized protein n=2 Tax=Macrostomum lignano TaxID=282301 RepID=A0A267G762_9PLAT|nr:hypothetical protein BOX15_Mlig016310g2 [Macrostomum lignano]PAA81858.1 hypothetical protein BOX15_Mlig019576g1 [Macrostomum lignano]PAA81886.1 hypothetical protein BOX15_Mlig016310g1 [Macrostomum lignano]